MTDPPRTPLTDALLAHLHHRLQSTPRGTAALLARQLAEHHGQPDQSRRWRGTLDKILNGRIRHPGPEVTLFLHAWLQDGPTQAPNTDGRRPPAGLS